MVGKAALIALAGKEGAAVLALWAALKVAGLPFQALVEIMAAAAAMGNVRGAAVGDVSLATEIDTLPLGIGRPESDIPRLESSFETVLTRHEDNPTPALERLVKTEVLHSGRQAYQEGMERHGAIGWRRELSEKPCERCRGWAGKGRVFPVGHKFSTHPLCECTQVPVLTGEET